MTHTGQVCQAWTSDKPHQRSQEKYIADNKFADGTVQAAKNYCRDPGGIEGFLWCYTTHPSYRWDTCTVNMVINGEHCTTKNCLF